MVYSCIKMLDVPKYRALIDKKQVGKLAIDKKVPLIIVKSINS